MNIINHTYLSQYTACSLEVGVQLIKAGNRAGKKSRVCHAVLWAAATCFGWTDQELDPDMELVAYL